MAAFKSILLCVPALAVMISAAQGQSPRPAVEQILLNNGDRISGVVRRTEKEVFIETAYAGIIRIALEHVASSSTNTRQSLTLATKDPKGTPAAAATAHSPTQGLFRGSPFFGLLDGWQGNTNIGFSYSDGNSSALTMTTGISATKVAAADQLSVNLRSQWNGNRTSTTHLNTQNSTWGGLRYERNANSRLFGFVSYDFERDRSRRLNFRSVGGAGIGNRWVNSDRTELETRLGGAWNQAWQIGANAGNAELLIGNSLKHRFNGRLKLQETFTFYQNATDRAEFRFLFDSTLSVDITKRIGWYFSVSDRFNNDPVGPAKKNDFLFTTGLKWNFGKSK